MYGLEVGGFEVGGKCFDRIKVEPLVDRSELARARLQHLLRCHSANERHLIVSTNTNRVLSMCV
jgi:hypothetical protein